MNEKMARFTLRVDPHLLAKLGYIAEFEGRTKNRELEHMIRQRIRAFEAEYGKIEADQDDFFPNRDR
ncbi:MAG: TraY domain-containing protein [Oscillospiraceae bacterium]